MTYLAADQVKAAFAKGVPMIEVGDYKIHASRREGPGMVEIHTRDTDIAYVLQGSATLVTGGAAVGVKDDRRRRSCVAPPSRAGRPASSSVGDVVVIPNGTPHWFKSVGRPSSTTWSRCGRRSRADGRGGDVMRRALAPRACIGRPRSRIAAVARASGRAGHGRPAGRPARGGRGSPHHGRARRWSQARWRYSDAKVVEVDHHAAGPDLRRLGPPNRTNDISPARRERRTSTTRRGRRSSPAALETRAVATAASPSTGTARRSRCPRTVGGFDVAGVDGGLRAGGRRLRRDLGGRAAPAGAGPDRRPARQGLQRAQPRRAHPRRAARAADPARRLRHQRARSPDPPANFIWIRSATLDFYRTGQVGRAGGHAGARWSGSTPRSTASCPGARSIEKLAGGFQFIEGPVWHPTATCSSATPTPTRSIAGRRKARSRSSAPRAATPASTSASTTSPAPTASRSTGRACSRSTSTATGG